MPRGRRLLGRRRARQRRRPAGAARGRRLRLQGFLIDSGVPEFPPLSAGRAAARRWRAVPALFVLHAEDPDAVRPRPRPRGTPTSWPRARRRPRTRRSRWRSSLAKAAQARVHILHLSSASALPLIAAARADGVRVTAETCPHYLTLTAEEVPDGATAVQVLPADPRRRPTRTRCGSGLADGTIDCVVSDHSPCPPDAEAPGPGDFAAAWGGIASLQLGLPVVWTAAAAARGHTLADVVSWMAARPAALAGLAAQGPHRGRPRRRPGRVRPGGDVHRRPGRAAPPQPGHAVRRTHAAGRGAAHLAARPRGGRHDARAAPFLVRGHVMDFRSLPDLASRAPWAAAWSPATTSSSRRPTTWSRRGRRSSTRRRSGPRARSTTAGRPAAAATPGHDWAVVRLGAPGIVRGVVVDTACFTGNYPPYASVDGGRGRRLPVAGRAGARRTGCRCCASPLAGDTAQRLRGGRRSAASPTSGSTSSPTAGWPGCGCTARWCPTRGCSATAGRRPGRAGERRPGRRLQQRVLRQPEQPAAARPGPDHGRGLGDRPPPRRRQRLGAGPAGLPGAVRLAELDTSHFKGNAPGEAMLTGLDARCPRWTTRPAWFGVLPRTRLQPDTRHRFLVPPSVGRRPTYGWTSTRTAGWPGCGCSASRSDPPGPSSRCRGSAFARVSLTQH